MAIWSLTIETGNAAFGDGPDLSGTDYDGAAEIARILEGITRDLRFNGMAANGPSYLHDINGNRCGKVTLVYAKRARGKRGSK